MAEKKQQENITKDKENFQEIGYVKPREIVTEMQEDYLDYAMSVIVSRALPDVRDGLKPVHRRILYAMHEDGLRHNTKFRKSANVVGLTLARYHPHGDMAVYDSLVRMAQDFSLRYPLVKGQGNFGCFTKDTKVKLTDGRDLSFVDIIKEQQEGKRHWGFTFNHQSQRIETAEIKNSRLTRKKEEIMEVILDNGQKIKCTLDHRFLLPSGKYEQAKDLRTGDNLMSLATKKALFELGFWGTAYSTMVRVCQPVIFILRSFQILSRPLAVEILGLQKKALDGTGFAPVDSWLANPNRYCTPPKVLSLYQNYKVLKTKILTKKKDVYDLSCNPWHNFLLAAGVFVHNSVDGDNAAASRYTECKLSAIGEEMLRDIDKNTINFMPNYDATRQEPTVLPSPLPQLLLNGSLGIAVGMATNIPPHNVTEILQATIYLIDHPQATTEDLFEFVKGPDFPTAGIIYGKKDIITAYSQGKGPILVRGKADIEEIKKGASQIIITEIPYQVSKSTLVQQFAKLVETKKVEGIKDIRDESDREGMRIAIDLKKEAFPKKVLNALFKYTDLQRTFHLNLLALVDGIQPRILSLVDVLTFYLKHKEEVVVRRIKFDLQRAKERAHILEGLMIALDNIDEVIKTIKQSDGREDASINLQKKFKLTELQAIAILEMRLQNLAKLERAKIENELAELQKKIKEFEAILKSPAKIKEVMKKELQEMEEKYKDNRKTKLMIGKIGEIGDEDLIPQEEAIITVTQGGFVKRQKPSVYKIQQRGGKGVSGLEVNDEDIVEHFAFVNTLDKLMFFTDSGKMFQCFAWEIAEMSKGSKGRGLLNFIDISGQDKVQSLLSYTKQDELSTDKYLVMITKDGIIKKTELPAFKSVRRNGLLAIKLQAGDSLRSAKIADKEDEISLVTRDGKSIRFKESDVRPMGRGASGVRAIKLSQGDEVVGMDIIKCQMLDVKSQNLQNLLIITENGYGKRTKLEEYRLQKRGGTGIKASRVNEKTGKIVFVSVLEGEQDLIAISKKGQVIRSSLNSVSIIGRASAGVRVMKLAKDDKVASAICL